MKKIEIKYDTLQSESGIATVGDDEIYFQRLRIKGNFLVVYQSRNGFDMKGRIKAVFDLSLFIIEVE